MNEIPSFPPLLENGEHLDRQTFHARYLKTPPGFKAELVGGMVFVASPVRSPHGQYHAFVVEWLGRYRTETPGVLLHDNATFILSEESQPQPDACLSLEAAKGGRSRIDENEYVVGPPELVVEVAHSTQSFDLFEKRRDYEQAGVQEYLVVALRDGALAWLGIEGGAFAERQPADDGVMKSHVFLGLWPDPSALLHLDAKGMQKSLERGMAIDEHAAFASKLAGLS